MRVEKFDKPEEFVDLMHVTVLEVLVENLGRLHWVSQSGIF